MRSIAQEGPRDAGGAERVHRIRGRAGGESGRWRRRRAGSVERALRTTDRRGLPRLPRSFSRRAAGDRRAHALPRGPLRGRRGPVADLGCGRGEFLDLLAEAGVAAIGVEINAADVEECTKRGHQATVADLFEWLEEQQDDALGGIFMAQVIEHLPPAAWQRLRRARGVEAKADGGRLVVETINPESLYAMARAYVVDPTHVRPVHPELLAFLSRRAGLHPVDVHFQSPVPDA